jgi:glycosyltransferase involved in cell wall biosynthesis
MSKKLLNKMHILVIPSEHFVTPRSPLGGIFQSEQAMALSNNGHKVGVISVGYISLRHFASSYPYEKRENKGSLAIYRKYKRSIFLERFINPVINVERHLRLFKGLYYSYEAEFGKPDVVHAHNFLYAGFMAEWLHRTWGIPYVLTEHSSAFALHGVSSSCDKMLKSVADAAGKLTCVSSGLKSLLQDRIKRNFALLPNIVDSSFFEIPLEDSLNRGSFVFLSVGSLDQNKNHEMLLRAFSAEFRQGKAVLKIVGNGPLLMKLQNLARSLGVASQVSFLGQLSREKVRDEMRSAHCLVHPSNYETFGVVLIESLACGLPLIATRSGGPEDIVNPGNGVLVDVGSETELAAAMRLIEQNFSRFDRQKLRDEAWNRFGEGMFVKNAVALYEEAI